MTLAAGDYDRKISFFAPGGVEDAMGTVGNDYSDTAWCAAWANVRFGSSADRRASAESRVADGIVSAQAATFRVLSSAKLRAVTEDYAISYGGALWGIRSIAEAAAQAAELEFTATRLGA